MTTSAKYSKIPVSPEEQELDRLGVSDNHRLIRMPVVRHMLGDVTKQTIYEWVRQGKLAEPVRMGVGAVAWRLSDIKAFIDSRV